MSAKFGMVNHIFAHFITFWVKSVENLTKWHLFLEWIRKISKYLYFLILSIYKTAFSWAKSRKTKDLLNHSPLLNTVVILTTIKLGQKQNNFLKYLSSTLIRMEQIPLNTTVLKIGTTSGKPSPIYSYMNVPTLK